MLALVLSQLSTCPRMGKTVAAELLDTIGQDYGRFYDLHRPGNKSVTGQRVDVKLCNTIAPSPMMYSTESGLVLYERVISQQQETTLLKKLAQPKVYNRKPGGEPETSKPEQQAEPTQLTSSSASESLFKPRPKKFAPQSEDPEQKAFREYYNRERATITANRVFTWGGRVKYSPPEPTSATRNSFVPICGKPPLRL